VARPWRLRHKLVLGLALVVGSVVLLLGGALFGQSSYLDTMQVTQRKLDEMQIVIQLRDYIHRAASPGQATPFTQDLSPLEIEKRQILGAVQDARRTLMIYRDMLENDSPDRLSTADIPVNDHELRQVQRIDEALTALETAVEAATGASAESPEDAGKPLLQRKGVWPAYQKLHQYATDLFQFLISDIQRSFERSNANFRRSLIISASATLLAVVLVFTLLYYFRVWIFAPIQEIQAGVQRVHHGNFSQPIQLQSHDELQELAEEFNAMMSRMREVYSDLERQVNERTRQLVRSERMVSVGFLAAGVAHEINNPLASIAFCAEALEGRLHDLLTRVPGDAEVINKYLKMIQQEAFRCKQITQKLLDFGRTGGKREATDLAQLVQDVIEMAHHLPNSRGKTLQFHPLARPVAPITAPDIKSVVLNLIVNALDSMDAGGVLTVSLTTRGEFAEMTFTDTGCGMTPDVLEHLFEPFFTRSRTGQGTGLGLSISHQIIDQHGGTITAESDGPKKGSRFIVRLPLQVADAPSETPAHERKTILPFSGQKSAA
jgi:two-component system NtrC family sensor kinase